MSWTWLPQSQCCCICIPGQHNNFSHLESISGLVNVFKWIQMTQGLFEPFMDFPKYSPHWDPRRQECWVHGILWFFQTRWSAALLWNQTTKRVSAKAVKQTCQLETFEAHPTWEIDGNLFQCPLAWTSPKAGSPGERDNVPGCALWTLGSASSLSDKPLSADRLVFRWVILILILIIILH